MTATLNVTHGGLSRDVCQLDYETGDTDVVRIAEESLELSPGALQYFVVDRFDTPEGGQRIYVRPKVPFGAKTKHSVGLKLPMSKPFKAKRRLYTDKPGQPWTDEANVIATKVHWFVETLLMDFEGVDLRDLITVLHSTVSNPVTDLILEERLA